MKNRVTDPTKLLTSGLARTKVECSATYAQFSTLPYCKKHLISAQSAFSLCHQPGIFKMRPNASSIVILLRSSCTIAQLRLSNSATARDQTLISSARHILPPSLPTPQNTLQSYPYCLLTSEGLAGKVVMLSSAEYEYLEVTNDSNKRDLWENQWKQMFQSTAQSGHVHRPFLKDTPTVTLCW
jgi:hypothetical protein